MTGMQLQFLSDTFQFETEATVTGSGEDDDGSYVVTNQTVFYPGGGGQEPDKGLITNGAGTPFPIKKGKVKNGEPCHYIDMLLPVNSAVKITIDRGYRLQNARLHTAGHLLSSVISEKLHWPLRPVKGFHYQKGAYMEFEPDDEIDEIPEETLHRAMEDDIKNCLPVSTAFVDVEDLNAPSVFVPEGFAPSKNRGLRLVTIKGYRSIPCGGTHLHHTGEIGSFAIKQIRHKKGRVRISYRAGEERD